MSFGWVNTEINKPFTLKEGDRVRAPYTFEIDGKHYKRDIIYKVTKVYKHIFMTETPDVFVPKVYAKRCFRKADYVCGYCRRV